VSTNLAYLNFPAEALPFKRSSVDVVFVAQARHWFDRPKFYAETARVLRP
jgi:ubiquinone/menaquinone biosynthesis C-methylase UbiE